MRKRGLTRALRALASLACVAILLAGSVPFSSEAVHAAPNANQLATFTAMPPAGATATYTGTNTVADNGDAFVGDDDIENISGVINITTDTLVKCEVSFANANSDCDFFVFSVPDGATTADLSDFDVVDSSALSANPEATGPARFGVATAKLDGAYALKAGKYAFGVSIFDDPTVAATAWTLKVTTGGTTEELIGDSGFPSSGVNITGGTQVVIVNAVSPTTFPYKVSALRTVHFAFTGQPNPVGKTMDVIVFKGPAPAAGANPVPPAITVPANLNPTTVTIAKTFQWVDYPITNGVTANAGEIIYIGVRYTVAGTGIIPSIDVGRDQKNRSFISANNGGTWRLLALSSGAPSDLLNRALGTAGAAPQGAANVIGGKGLKTFEIAQ